MRKTLYRLINYLKRRNLRKFKVRNPKRDNWCREPLFKAMSKKSANSTDLDIQNFFHKGTSPKLCNAQIINVDSDVGPSNVISNEIPNLHPSYAVLDFSTYQQQLSAAMQRNLENFVEMPYLSPNDNVNPGSIASSLSDPALDRIPDLSLPPQDPLDKSLTFHFSNEDLFFEGMQCTQSIDTSIHQPSLKNCMNDRTSSSVPDIEIQDGQNFDKVVSLSPDGASIKSPAPVQNESDVLLTSSPVLTEKCSPLNFSRPILQDDGLQTCSGVRFDDRHITEFSIYHILSISA